MTKQSSPDQTGTWAPNLHEIGNAIGIVMSDLMKEICARRMVAEYRRQQAAQGMVVVQRETLQRAKVWWDVYTDEGYPHGPWCDDDIEPNATAIHEIMTVLAAKDQSS